VTPPTPGQATLLVLLAACCFGSISILTVLGRAGGATLLTILTLRYLLGSAGLMLASGGPAKVRVPPRRLLALVGLGGAGQALVTGTSLASLEYIPAAALGFLFYTYPAWITLIAAVRRTEPLTPVRLAALALSLSGIVMMVGNPFASRLPVPGLLLALGAAFCYALYVPLLRRLGEGTSAAVSSTWITAGACLVLGAVGAARGELAVTGVTPAAWGAIVAMALVSTVLAFIAFLKGLAVLGPVRTAIVSTVEPFWTAMLGALVLTQPLTSGAVAGGAMIALAVALLQAPARPGRRSA
jgi:drug/metabolite transporter (DMT)-like permease